MTRLEGVQDILVIMTLILYSLKVTPYNPLAGYFNAKLVYSVA